MNDTLTHDLAPIDTVEDELVYATGFSILAVLADPTYAAAIRAACRVPRNSARAARQ
jgi:hypothetical protein